VGKLPLFPVGALLIAAGFLHAKQPVDPEQASFAKRSGKELVQQLADDKKRPRAFYELLRRAEPSKYPEFAAFEVGHYNSKLVICPQENPRPPIYLVLYGFLELMETGYSRDNYQVKNPRELFPPATNDSGTAAVQEPAIHAFTADGRVVHPFGGDTVLKGTLADINGDGIIERVDSMMYGVEGIHDAIVLTVSTVKTKAQPLLTVVLNWGADEWIYRLTDQDGDGVSDIEAGPRTATGLIPKAVWKWDRVKKLYVGPQGQAGDHFRVINGVTLWKELAQLKAARLTFPKDGDAVSIYETKPKSATVPTPSPQAPTPYRHASLKDAPDSELLRFMAQGKRDWDRQETGIHNRLPEDFWNMDAKSAALALVQTNRTEAHRARYQIAIDARDKAEPPPRCTIGFSTASARCYDAIDGHYFLRVDPDDSYLAFAGSSSAGVVFYNAVYDQPVFDIRICPLPYEEARKIGEVIWWLDRVRSRAVRADSQNSTIVSSGDGSGRVIMRAEGRAIIDHAKTLWYNLASRWTDNYKPETFLNFAGYLVADALPARLGNKWSQFEPTEQRLSESRQDSAAVYTDAERKRLQDFSERFLGWFSPQEEKISFSLVNVAAQCAGDFGIVSDASRLREIESALPPPARPKRSYDEVEADRSKLPYAFEIKDPKKRKRVEQQQAALDAELDAILYEDVSDSPDLLRNSLAVSLRKLAVAPDLDRLSTLAVSKSDAQQWALRCLAQLDRKRYADALETLTRKTTGQWARQFFSALARADQPRALTIARDLPAEKIDPLTIPAFLVLGDSGAVPEETQRLATIIKMLHDPKTGWQERAHAVEALVPQNNPLRYPGREIDDALLKVLTPEQADENGTFTQEEACLALARRGRTQTFDRIVEQLQKTRNDAGSYGRFLEALTHLAQSDPGQLNPRLVEIVRPDLSHTNKSVPGLIWMIWGADLHELQPDIERLATANPDEFEDIKASSYGGSASAVTGRFHLARKILSLWSEPDPLTRAKLLVAFCASEAEEFFRNPHPERLTKLKADMNRASDELSPDAKDALRAFVAAIDSKPDTVDEGRVLPEMIHKATTLARTELRL
jgi:hypothetical protein